jgi:hypothetical protein
MSEDVPLATKGPVLHESPSASVPPEAVRAQLQRILEGSEFRSSKRCQDFLTFIVGQTLAGLPLKERTVGAAVFGREASYDTNEDGIVRIKAGEVRKRLGLYYAGCGKDDEVVIDLPVGHYVPSFSLIPRNSPGNLSPASIENLPAVLATEHSEEQIFEARRTRGVRWRFAWASGLLLVIAFVAIAGWKIYSPPSVLDQFWEPVLRSRNPIIVATSYAPVYYPSSSLGPPSAARTPHDTDFVLLSDQYVGGGDLLAAARISGMLSHMGHRYTIRIGNAVTFEDLRSAPAILIGYSSTHWEGVTRGFRFFIDDQNQGIINDNGKPTDWYPHHLSPDFHTDEDYAVLSRAFDPQTHTMIVLVSGCTQYGTEAAAELITDPTLLAEALHSAPDGWQKKNLQLVLHMKVIANAPASPQVIASHYW